MNYVCFFTFSLTLICGTGAALELSQKGPELMLSFLRDMRPIDIMSFKDIREALVFTKVVLLSAFISNGVEFICYLLLFWEMYKHHKKHVKLCLSNKPQLAKKKRRQNTISTVGHFASWLSEIILVYGFIHYVVLGKHNTENISYIFFFLRLFLPSINYIVFPSVQAIASEDLRKHVFSLDHFKGICLNCGNNKKDDSPEDIELQVIHHNYNGHAHQMSSNGQ